MVLQTMFTTAGGTAVLTDALALGRNDCGHHLGAGSPGVLLRRLVCTSAEIDAEVSAAQIRASAGVRALQAGATPSPPPSPAYAAKAGPGPGPPHPPPAPRP